MNKALRLYWKFLQPWLTVIVYLWVLQLIADFSVDDPEPLLDRLADCAAILWTLVFWTSLAAIVLCLVSVFFTRNIRLMSSDGIAKVAAILITAFFFLRWLFNWAVVLNNSEIVLYALVSVCAALSVWVYCRRKHQSSSIAFPAEDAWSYFALPVLAVTASIILFKMGDNTITLKNNQTAIGRVADAARSERQSKPRPNIVVIVADALRAQNMSVYGYGRKTTPFLEGFAERSSVYTQMYSNSTSTRISLTSILTGKRPLSHGRLTKFLPRYESPENLVALLRDAGYTSAAVSSNVDATFYALGLAKYLVHGEYPNFRRLTLSFLRDNGIYPTNPGNRMYDELDKIFPFLGFPERSREFGRAENTLRLAVRLATELPEPFFLFIHVHEPHDPYETPQPFRGKYARRDFREVHEKLSSYYYQRYPPQLQPFVDDLKDYYDEAIEFLDTELASFVQTFEHTTRARNSLLIITGDHGESLERGFLNHGEDLYESSIRVPLIIQFLNQQVGYRLSTPVQSIDLAPTILHAIGIPTPAWIDGAPASKQKEVEAREIVTLNFKDPADRKIYDRPTKMAIRWLQYKLIVSCDTKRLELYNIATDPQEQHDLVQRETELVKELWVRLEQRLANQKNNPRLVCDAAPHFPDQGQNQPVMNRYNPGYRSRMISVR